ncbi:ABC transporter substrate-binding protein [Pseudonocardiaceae bacterium YIM PH 21723]|nr:ABC transporter substrate-binding protein [Pseudonocardiaceae bacterium YIM PH 21723]
MSSRRRVIAAAALIAVAGLFGTACGGTDTAATGNAAWSFKDDSGKEIKKDKKPLTIVAEANTAGTLWEYGIKVKGVFGPQKLPNGQKDPQVGNVDLSQVTDLGQEYGQVNLEKLAALKPDIVVTTLQEDLAWGIDKEAVEKVNAIAPIVGIRITHVDSPKVIKRFEDLVTALGGKVDSPEITKAKADVAKAEQAVKDAAKAKSGLKVEAVAGGKDNLYVGIPGYYHDLSYFTSLGVNFVSSNDPKEAWDELSWEQAGKFKADLILVDNRAMSLSNDQLKQSQPTWQKLPAVVAGQVGTWHVLSPITYAANAVVLNDLAANITKAKVLP